MAEKHLIKKYANRKLYDTRTSRYITLDGISALVRDGYDIEVVDRESGADITPLVLSQIVMGEEKRGGTYGADAENGHDRGQALLDYVRRTLNVPAALVTGEVERRRGDLEELVEGAIESALDRLMLPSRREVERLSEKVDELSRRIDRLGAGPSRTPARPKRTRTRTAAARK